MKVFHYLLSLIAVIITGRADLIPERTRRDENQIPVGDEVAAYGSSLVSFHTKAQLSAEIGEGGADKDYNLQAPDGLAIRSSKEANELIGAEANVVTGYDGEVQYNGGNTLDDYDLVLPSEGFGYGNQFKAAVQAGALAEAQIGETTYNGGMIPPDATTQTQLQAQFGKEAQYGTETQANAIVQENQDVQYGVGTKTQTSPGIIPFPYETIPGSQTNYESINPFAGPLGYDDGLKKINIYKENSPGTYGKLLKQVGQGPGSPYAGLTRVPPTNPTGVYGGSFEGTIPQVDKVMYTTKYYNIPTVFNKYPQAIPLSVPISDTGIENKPIGLGYEVTQSPYWVQYQKENNKKHWKTYTKPIQGESLAQAEGEAQIGGKARADAIAQENGEPQYQDESQANLVIQTSKGVEVTAASAGAEAKTYAGSDGQYNAETQTNAMFQMNSGSQYETAAQADVVVQSRGVQYSGENKLTSSAQADAKGQTNVASSYHEKSQHNEGAHYEGGSAAKATAQTSEGTKYSESTFYGDTAKYNGGFLKGEGFPANAKSNLGSGAQFGAGTDAVVQAGTVIETRFGPNTRPLHRPLPGFSYRHPLKGWNHG